MTTIEPTHRVVCEWCDSDGYLGEKRSKLHAQVDRSRHNDYCGHLVGGAEVEPL